MDDPGVHAACCGANTWTAAKGSATVFINGKSAHRMGDQTRHCGGMGQLAEGSPNVIVGEAAVAASGAGGGKPSGGSAPLGRSIPAMTVSRPAVAATPNAATAVTPSAAAAAAPSVAAVAPSSSAGAGATSGGAGASGPSDAGAPTSPKPLLPETGDLVVTVTGPEGRVAGAVVRIAGAVSRQGRTDNTGSARFLALPPGSYQLDATKDGLQPGNSTTTAVVKQDDDRRGRDGWGPDHHLADHGNVAGQPGANPHRCR